MAGGAAEVEGVGGGLTYEYFMFVNTGGTS